MQRRVSNPELNTKNKESGSFLDRVGHGGRNSHAVAQTGATSGVALYTNIGGLSQEDLRKPSK